MDDTLTA